MNFFKTLIIVLCCCSATMLSAQKQTIKKANNLYKLNQFKDAIGLYEEALQQKDNLSARTKLAYCYRMNNQMGKAEEEYSRVVENEKAKSITYFYYAESLMSNGKYDLAKNWFLKYNEKEPGDENAIRMAYACDKVKTLSPYFKNVGVEEFEHNSEVDDASALYFNEGIVFTSDRSSGKNPLKQKSGWTGRDFQRIYFSKANGDGSYDEPTNFSKKLNDLNKHCGPVSFTKDKKVVVFTRTGQELGKNKSYNIQLYSAESEDGTKWKKVKLLSFCSKENNYMHPAISPDGSKLFFISDKPGGLGGTDIYVCDKRGDDWGKPRNLGPIVNTQANEAFPFFHESGKLFFSSKGHLSYGGFDILFSNEKEGQSWQKPVNVGKPINSSYDDIALSLDESMESGMFSSSRNGGDDDIYIFKVMEGVNVTLDSVDFDVAGWQRNEEEYIEPTPSSNTVNQKIENEVIATETAIKKEVDELPVKNMEGEIRNDESLEIIREEIAPDVIVDVPSKIEESVKVNSPSPTSSHTEPIPDRKVEILDMAPAVEEVEEVEEFEEELIEESIDNGPSMRTISEEVNIEEVKDITETEITTVSSASSVPTQKETTSRKVDLIIPAKKNRKINAAPSEEEVSETFEPEEVYVEEGKVEETKIKDLIIEEAVDEPLSDPVVNEPAMIEVATEPVIESTPEPLSENTSILDRTPMETPDPVLLGGDQSLFDEETPALARLAELIQSGEAIPAQGFKIKGLNYPRGSYLLSPEGTRSLASLIDLMTANPSLKVEIGSHTSALGDDVDNHNLSRKRAMSIQAFLVYKGIANERVSAKGYGETQLINNCSNGANCPPADHAENDRVEVKVMR